MCVACERTHTITWQIAERIFQAKRNIPWEEQQNEHTSSKKISNKYLKMPKGPTRLPETILSSSVQLKWSMLDGTPLLCSWVKHTGDVLALNQALLAHAVYVLIPESLLQV